MNLLFHHFITSNNSIELCRQESLKVNEAGDLEITTSLGKIFEEHPYAYQLIDARGGGLWVCFSRENISFQLGKYDKSKH